MLRYGAAAVFAALILGWPGCAGSDTDTFWSKPSAAVLASANAASSAQAEPAPEVALMRTAPLAVKISTSAEAASVGDVAPPPPVTVTSEAAPLQSVPVVSPVAIPNPRAEATVAEANPVQRSEPAFHDDPHLIIGNRTASIEPVEPNLAPRAPAAPVTVPFGLAVTPVSYGEILTKWNGVEAKIQNDNEILARCDTDPRDCPQAARNFRAVIALGLGRGGLARIGTINRAVNLEIEPMSDMAQWGVPDRWSNPLETFATGRGDCEDYAIAKYVALTAAGVPADDVKLVIVRNTAADEDHAVVAVRNDGDWIILDNRWLTMVRDVEMAKAIPLFVLDDAGVRAFAEPVRMVARRAAAPASLAE